MLATQMCQRGAAQSLPFTEKREVLDLVREKKKKDSYAEFAKIYSKNKSSILKL